MDQETIEKVLKTLPSYSFTATFLTLVTSDDILI